MNKEKRALLIGLAIGDGCVQNFVHRRKSSTNENIYETTLSKLVINHSIKQIEYADHKRKLINSLLGGKPIELIHTKQYLKKTDKTYRLVRISKTAKQFKYVRRWLYPNGVKYISRRILNALNPYAIAIWYMDDGSLKKHINTAGKVSSISLTISTYCDKEQAEGICLYFKEKWNIEFKLAFHSRFNLYYIRANSLNSNKFIDLVKPYIVESMKYKIDSIPRMPDIL